MLAKFGTKKSQVQILSPRLFISCCWIRADDYLPSVGSVA